MTVSAMLSNVVIVIQQGLYDVEVTFLDCHCRRRDKYLTPKNFEVVEIVAGPAINALWPDHEVCDLLHESEQVSRLLFGKCVPQGSLYRSLILAQVRTHCLY